MGENGNGESARRPIGARHTNWAGATARWLAREGFTPNQVSVGSVVFSAMAGACFVGAGYTAGVWRAVLFIAAAALIVVRLLCNMFDGMLAVEGGMKSKAGEIYNDLPDRLSDAMILVAAGYSIPDMNWGGELGWCAAVLAVITAHVRVLGASAGTKHFFCGPMAKPHRMAVMIAACAVAAAEAFSGYRLYAVAAALIIVTAGSAVTAARRTLLIVKALETE